LEILYVHPAKQEADARFDKYIPCSPYPFIPVGVVGLVNMLRREGWDVAGLNLPMELTMRPDLSFRRWLADQPPAKMALIDLHWYEHCFGAIDTARMIKSVWPDAVTVIGGLTTSNFAEEILASHPEVDYAIRGDAEEPLRQLARYVFGGDVDAAAIPNLVRRTGSEVRQNPRSYFATGEMLDGLDFVSTDWLAHAQSYGAIQYSGAGWIRLQDPDVRGHWLTIGRGCVFNCIYCGGGKHSHSELAGRNGYVMRSPEAVAEDIRRLRDAGYRQVALSLDPATFGPEWWQTLFRLLRQKAVKIGIYNEFFQLPSREFIAEFSATADMAHTEVAISPLSGDEEVRRQNGKFYANERFLRTLEDFKRFEIPIFVYFSLNLPGETFKTFKRTLELAQAVGQAYPSHLLRMLNPCHTLDPMSPMSRNPEQFGMEVAYRTFADYYNYCRATGWQPRNVLRGQHRGFEMKGRPTKTVEQMAQIWDLFAEQQPFRCFPVPRGW